MALRAFVDMATDTRAGTAAWVGTAARVGTAAWVGIAVLASKPSVNVNTVSRRRPDRKDSNVKRVMRRVSRRTLVSHGLSGSETCSPGRIVK